MLFMWNYAIWQITLRQKHLLSEYHHVYYTESPVSCVSGQDGTYEHDNKFCLQCNKNNKKTNHIKTKQKSHTQKEKKRMGKNVQGHTPILSTHLPWTN